MYERTDGLADRLVEGGPFSQLSLKYIFASHLIFALPFCPSENEKEKEKHDRKPNVEGGKRNSGDIG